jgi:hypothetical protein
MSVWRVLPPRHFAFAFAISTAVVIALGSSIDAQAQDLNLQSRINTFSPPIVFLTPEIAPSQTPELYNGTWTCVSDAQFVYIHYKRGEITLPPNPPQNPPLKQDNGSLNNNPLITYLTANKQYTDNLLKTYLQRRRVAAALPTFPIDFCAAQQPTTVKVTIPFNPDYESNVLKSSQNNSPGTSLGFGGALQVTAAGARPYDVIGLSVGSASARYNPYSSKSFDSITTQGAYQFFIDAFGYKTGGIPVDNITKETPKTDLPYQGMTTVDTVALGFVNQTAYTTPFHLETADLFTPQVTFGRQNISLAGGGRDNECAAASENPKQDGFCYYANLALTIGQTFSDLQSQQNASVAALVTPGWRIPDSDWNLTLPTTATARAYENFPGGREDVLLQIGPALTYAHAFSYPTINTSVAFSLSATYNQNFSTVSAAAWHGFIVMPALTIAFQPSK